MTVATSILASITVAETEGRAIPDAATRQTIGYAPVHTVTDLDIAITNAQAAQPAWNAARESGQRSVDQVPPPLSSGWLPDKHEGPRHVATLRRRRHGCSRGDLI